MFYKSYDVVFTHGEKEMCIRDRAMIAGTAYCIKSFPMLSVPNAVGVFCAVILLSLIHISLREFVRSIISLVERSNRH